MKATRRTILKAALAASSLPALQAVSGIARAAQYPDRPIRLVAPFSAGGVTDLVTRIVAQQLNGILKTSVVVDNRPGAGGNIGSTFVAKSDADGYTLLAGSLSTYALNAGMTDRLGHNPLTDLVPVALTAMIPIVLVVPPSLGVKDLKGLIALLKANPNKYNYGSAGNGTSAHIALHMFLQRTGTQATHVPYKGTSQALIDLLAGTVSMAVASPSVVQGYVREGKLIAIAAVAPSRLKAMPEVPTMAEAGLPNFDVYSWNCIFAPAKTPPAILDQLHDAVEKAVSTPAVRATLEKEGTIPMIGYSRAATDKYVRDEYARWVPYVKKLGVSNG
nr:tripartite tricarboxylate transporter substrate binding protein [uncultured Cupriavidus sp.]